MRTSSAAVLIDGTAVYFRSREGRSESGRLDYEGLNQHLLKKAGVASFDPALLFTAFDPQNEGQSKFLSFLRSRLKWEVEARPVWDADPLPKDAPWEKSERRSEFIRFDASISFALGKLLGHREKIIVVSDSFGLEQPLLAASAYGTSQVVLAFFGHQLDSRWISHTRDSNSKIQFWDLDEYSSLLFGRDFVPNNNTRSSALTRLR